MANSDYALLYSTNEIFRDTDDTRCLTDDLDNIESNISTLQTNKSDIDHTHTNYALINHTHSGYATSEHTHSYSSITDVPTALLANGGNADTVDGKHASDFAGTSDITALQTQINNKSDASHGHSNYAVLGASNEFNGEQKLTNSQYCATLIDSANGIGCALKASRGLFNELLVDKIYMTPYTGQIPFYTYNGTSSGSMSSTTKVGYIDSSGNASFTGNVSASNLVDTVVFQGTSDNFQYQKWASGKVEAWYFETLGTVSLTTSMAGGVWSNESYCDRIINFPPGLFVDIPMAIGNIYSNGYTLCQVSNADTTRMIHRIWSPYSATITGAWVIIYVVGKWK